MSEDQNASIEIEKHRAVIDSLDEQIVTLLNKRAKEALDIRALKPQAQMGLYDPKRGSRISTMVPCTTMTSARYTRRFSRS